MTGLPSLSIYIASSARNMHGVCLLRDALKARGHSILDWTAYAPPLPDTMTPEERKAALDSDERGEIFAFCAEACMKKAHLLVYLGAAGQDAACEVGMAYASGITVLGLASPTERPGLIIARAVSHWCTDVADLLQRVDELAQAMAP